MDIEQASNFWIEAGAMSGGSPDERHQVELPNGVVQFFDPEARRTQEVMIQPPMGPAVARPLRHRDEEQAWADMWRLSLPTKKNMGGVDYAGNVLLFTRVPEGQSFHYVLKVAPPGLKQAQWWRRQSELSGGLGKTGGPAGREYGYW